MSNIITDFLGEGLHSARPATPSLPAGTVGLYWSSDTTTLSAWDGSAWHDVGAGGGGVTPTIIQSKTVAIGGSQLAFTLGGAPAAGNLLIAIFTHWSGSPTSLSPGWTILTSQPGQSDSAGLIAYKVAGGSESATQTVSTGSDAFCGTLFEIHGAKFSSIASATVAASVTSGTTQALDIGVPANNSIIVGMFMTELTGSPSAATLSGGLTAEGTANTTSGSGSDRSTAGWSQSASAGAETPSVTWSVSGELGYGYVVLTA